MGERDQACMRYRDSALFVFGGQRSIQHPSRQLKAPVTIKSRVLVLLGCLYSVCTCLGALQVSSAIDSDSHRPAFPRKILLIQLARVEDAVETMERCVASISHTGLRQRLVKPLEVCKSTLREVERLGTSVALAQLIDAADALCMLGVGISAVTQQCAHHIHQCPRDVPSVLNLPPRTPESIWLKIAILCVCVCVDLVSRHHIICTRKMEI